MDATTDQHDDRSRSAGNGRADSPDPAAAAAEAVDGLKSRVSEVAAYVGQYAGTWVDRAVALARDIALWIGLAAVAAVIGVAALATAGVLLVVGLAQLVGGAINGNLDEMPWAGNLIVGGGVVLLVLIGGWLGIKFMQTLAYRSAVRKYDRMQAEQMMTTGHCAAERAAEADDRRNPAAAPPVTPQEKRAQTESATGAST